MLEISKRQKLEAERDGYREYIEEVRERAEKKSDRLDDFQVVHNNMEANEKSYLEDSLKWAVREEQRIMNRVKALEEQIEKEVRPVEKILPIQAQAIRAGQLGVINSLGKIGLSWGDIGEVTEECSSLIEEASRDNNEEDDTEVSKEDLEDEEFEDEREVHDG